MLSAIWGSHDFLIWALTTTLSIFETVSLFHLLSKVPSEITSLIPVLGHLSFVWPTFPPSLSELHGALCQAAR